MYKIMIIDDDPVSLSIGKAFLEDDYEVTLIRSGQQALGQLNGKDLPDLILMDMMMPGIDGLDLFALIQQNERHNEIPVIFLTGNRSVESELKGYSLGAADFLQKPVDRYLLKYKIQQHLSYSIINRENQRLLNQLNQLNLKA